MTLFPCPYLLSDVELTDERERHIAEQHPDLFPEYRDKIADVLADPDQVRRSARFNNARLFFPDGSTMCETGSMWSSLLLPMPRQANAIGWSRLTSPENWREV